MSPGLNRRGLAGATALLAAGWVGSAQAQTAAERDRKSVV